MQGMLREGYRGAGTGADVSRRPQRKPFGAAHGRLFSLKRAFAELDKG
jgi:hypothetical protein